MTEDERKRLANLNLNLQLRALIIDFTRSFFKEQGFLEVETPVRVPVVAPEAYIVPFQSENWLLSTSPELHMKRLLAAGYDKLFQITRCFRKGERGKLHNPEFTMLEWYCAGGDYNQMVRDTEGLLERLGNKLGLGNKIKYRGTVIDIKTPWHKITVRDAYLKSAGWNPVAEHDPLKFDTDFVDKVQPDFPAGVPTVLTDYPAAMASLARLKPGNPQVAERAEVFIGGLEIANVYSELNDAREQEARFKEAIEQIKKETGRQATMPEKFIEAVSQMPDCGGAALGIDRLVMLLCDAESIDEVMPFTSDTA